MKKLATPEKILRAAHKLFDKKGPDAVTMRRVAEAVGITPMAIYRHFVNREALLKRLSDDSFNTTAKQWQTIAQHPDVEQRLFSLLEPILDYALEHPHLFDHAFLAPRDDARRFPEDFKARRSPTMNVTADIISEAMQQGALRQDDAWDVTMTASALQLGLIALYRAGRFSYDEAGFRQFYFDSMRRLIDGIKT